MKGSQITAILRRFLNPLKLPRQTSGFDLRSHNRVIAAKDCHDGAL